MSDYLQGDAYRALKFGPLVTKTSVSIPNNTTSALFTVSTGNVFVTSLYGVLTSPATSASATLSLGIITSAATSTTSIATGTAIGTIATGVWATPQVSSGKAGALVLGTDSSTVLYKPAEFVAPVGTITWTTGATAASGKFTWYLTYVPLDNGANVT